MRCRWRSPCAWRGLCPLACKVKSGNWQASQLRARTPSRPLPSSTISKQWQTGHRYAQTPHPTHASGHNPRHAQGDRQRQRIYHKFYVYPEKFGETLCTGCGNCARNCPVGLGVLPLVTEIPHAEPVQA